MTHRSVSRAFLGFWGLSLGFLALSACGSTGPTGTPKPKVSLPPPAPGPSVAPAPPDTKAIDLVAKAQKAFAALPGYRTEMKFFQKGPQKSSDGLYDLSGKPLRHMRIEILEGGGKGTRLLWNGGASVKARAPGLLSPIVITLPLADERMQSVRGYTLAQTNIASLLDMMADKRNHLAYVGTSGNSEVVSATGRYVLGGCSKMTASLDRTSLMPVGVDATDGREVVFKVRLQKFRADPAVKLEI